MPYRASSFPQPLGGWRVTARDFLGTSMMAIHPYLTGSDSQVGQKLHSNCVGFIRQMEVIMLIMMIIVLEIDAAAVADNDGR